MSSLLHMVLSWLGVGGGAVLLAGAALVVFRLGLPRTIAAALLILAAAWIYTGVIYQAGGRAERQKWQAAAAAEKQRQEEASADAVADLVAELALAQKAAADADRRAEDLRKSIASRPAVPGRGATEEDVRALDP